MEMSRALLWSVFLHLLLLVLAQDAPPGEKQAVDPAEPTTTKIKDPREPPTKIKEPPTKIKEPPTKIKEPPTKIKEPPTKIKEPPTRHIDDPKEPGLREQPAQLSGSGASGPPDSREEVKNVLAGETVGMKVAGVLAIPEVKDPKEPNQFKVDATRFPNDEAKDPAKEIKGVQSPGMELVDSISAPGSKTAPGQLSLENTDTMAQNALIKPPRSEKVRPNNIQNFDKITLNTMGDQTVSQKAIPTNVSGMGTIFSGDQRSLSPSSTEEGMSPNRVKNTDGIAPKVFGNEMSPSLSEKPPENTILSNPNKAVDDSVISAIHDPNSPGSVAPTPLQNANVATSKSPTGLSLKLGTSKNETKSHDPMFLNDLSVPLTLNSNNQNALSSVSRNSPQSRLMGDWSPSSEAGRGFKSAPGKSSDTSHVLLRESCSVSLPAAINDFTFALLRLWQEEKSANLLISPLALSVALAMVYHGAGGNTAKQMELVLGYEKHKLVDIDVTNGFVDILATLTENDEENKLLLANDMFIQKNYAVSPKYIADLMAFFLASVQNVDFVNDGLSTMNQVNSWVADKTESAIPSLFKKPLGSPEGLVISVAFFKGLWMRPFPREETIDASFYSSDGKEKKVPMMTIKNELFRYLDDIALDYQFLELPYKGEDLNMLLALPNRTDASPDLDMTSELLCRVNSSMRTTLMATVSIPKFRLDFQDQMVDTLKTMGITDLFDSSRANLTEISSQSGLYVGSVYHRAVLDVAEDGAKTPFVAASSSKGMAEPTNRLVRALDFLLNHPFLLYIIDKRNGLVLFSGKVINPSD